MPGFTTDRLSLAPINQKDMGDLLDLWSQADFTRYITGRALGEEEVWLRCLRDIGHWQVLGHGNWAIREIATGQFVGTVGVLNYCRDISPAIDSPELGWGLHPRFQGKGLAFEAVSAALEWADQHLNAPRTLCMISPDNRASVRLAQRLGYRTWMTTRYKDSEVVLYERPRCAQD